MRGGERCLEVFAELVPTADLYTLLHVPGSVSRAIENQGAVNKDLQSLLELLLSENRAKQLESEKARLRDYLKRLNALINQQKGIQGRTAGGGEPKGLADEQAKLAGKTGELARDVKAGEEASDKASGKPADADGKDGQGKDGQGKDGQGKEGQAKEGQAKEGQAKEGQGKGGQGKGQGQGKEDDQQEGGTPPSSQEQTPARKRLEAAQQRMREAEEKLKEAQRKGAVEKQEEAIRELEQAKAELEEILRQLREEEIERVLAMLEARFAKMLAMQRAVLEGTLKVDGVPREKRTRDHEVEAGRLSSREAEIDLEAEKATSLLREDGTAVAFPEALDQLRQDVRQVVQRLAEAKVDKITQGIEEDVIAALEEMIQALQKAQKDRQKKPPPPGTKPMEGEAQDPPLVDVLAELNKIRALQMRVNTRTERYSKLIEGEQARNPDLVEALRRLSERQERVYKITRDLHTGKNR
jgi:hypothetical protein